VWVGVRWHGCWCRGDLSGDTMVGLPKGRFPPAHPQAPQARGRSPHHPPSVHAIPTACTSTPRHGGEGARAHGRTGTRAGGDEVVEQQQKNTNRPQTTKASPKPSGPKRFLPPHTHAHAHTYTYTHSGQGEGVSLGRGWVGQPLGASLPTPQGGGKRGGGGVVTSVVTTAKNSLTLYVPPSRL
jgi:hypothetical protein